MRPFSLALLFLLALREPANGAPFTVLNTADSGPGSLRQAILDANATPGADSIVFNIPGSSLHTISPLTALPPLTDDAGATIDGYTQPGSSPNTLAMGDNAILTVELTGISAAEGTTGITIRSSFNSIRGLLINRFDRGISILRGSHSSVTGCFVGTDAGGSVSRANRTGIHLEGTEGLGNVVLPLNDQSIGGTDPGSRNLVSGNTEIGVGGVNVIDSVFEGNYIGTTRSGISALANGIDGVLVTFSARLTIGGSAPGAGNLISGNAGAGIALGPTLEFLIQGNRIGTTATGLAPLPNGIGIVAAQADRTRIGGSGAGEGNLVSGNQREGIRLANCRSYVVQGNIIGADSSGLLPVPNLGDGVFIFVASNRHTIGGPGPSEGNVIAYNGQAGVAIGQDTADGSAANRVSGNSIHDNGGLGIDLASDGPTGNDPADPDTGPNTLQNFPVLSSATSNGVTTDVHGSLDTLPSVSFTIELFANPACDASGNGEGQTFLGATAVTTDGSGHAAIDVTLTTPSLGQVVTATATEPSGNTSEFSACVTVMSLPSPSAPVPLGWQALAALGLLLAAAGAWLLR